MSYWLYPLIAAGAGVLKHFVVDKPKHEALMKDLDENRELARQRDAEAKEEAKRRNMTNTLFQPWIGARPRVTPGQQQAPMAESMYMQGKQQAPSAFDTALKYGGAGLQATALAQQAGLFDQDKKAEPKPDVTTTKVDSTKGTTTVTKQYSKQEAPPPPDTKDYTQQGGGQQPDDQSGQLGQSFFVNDTRLRSLANLKEFIEDPNKPQLNKVNFWNKLGPSPEEISNMRLVNPTQPTGYTPQAPQQYAQRSAYAPQPPPWQQGSRFTPQTQGR